MSDTVFTLGRDPEYVDFVVPSATDFDPSTVTAWEIRVLALAKWGQPIPTPADEVVWSHSVISVDASQAHLRHVFAASGDPDIPLPGKYRIRIIATTPAGDRRTLSHVIVAEEAQQ